MTTLSQPKGQILEGFPLPFLRLPPPLESDPRPPQGKHFARSVKRRETTYQGCDMHKNRKTRAGSGRGGQGKALPGQQDILGPGWLCVSLKITGSHPALSLQDLQGWAACELRLGCCLPLPHKTLLSRFASLHGRILHAISVRHIVLPM